MPQTLLHPTNISSHKSSPSYAQKVQNKVLPLTEITHPDDDQGFFFESILDYKLRDYLIAIKDLVNGPQNIIVISPIGKKRIAIHLKSKDVLNDFMMKHGGFLIESNFIKCTRLKSIPLTKVVLSHVNPSIPNSLLNQFFTNELKINIKIPISFLRLNPHDQLFPHVLTWRRQFHTDTVIDREKLPQSFLIENNGQKHRIFITLGDSACYKCHKEGHRVEDCPLSDDEMVPENIIEKIEISNNSNSSLDLNLSFPPLPRPTTKTSKEIHPSPSSSPSPIPSPQQPISISRPPSFSPPKKTPSVNTPEITTTTESTQSQDHTSLSLSTSPKKKMKLITCDKNTSGNEIFSLSNIRDS